MLAGRLAVYQPQASSVASFGLLLRLTVIPSSSDHFGASLSGRSQSTSSNTVLKTVRLKLVLDLPEKALCNRPSVAEYADALLSLVYRAFAVVCQNRLDRAGEGDDG